MALESFNSAGILWFHVHTNGVSPLPTIITSDPMSILHVGELSCFHLPHTLCIFRTYQLSGIAM